MDLREDGRVGVPEPPSPTDTCRYHPHHVKTQKMAHRLAARTLTARGREEAAPTAEAAWHSVTRHLKNIQTPPLPHKVGFLHTLQYKHTLANYMQKQGREASSSSRKPDVKETHKTVKYHFFFQKIVIFHKNILFLLAISMTLVYWTFKQIKCWYFLIL